MSMTVYDKELNQYDKDCIATEIVLSGSGTVTTVKGEPNVFHWRFYLVIAPGPSQNRSVVVDMIPANHPAGVMVIASKPDAESGAADKVKLTILIRGSPTVSQIINVFLEHKMQCYMFDDSGSGCLYWMFTGLHFLVEHGLVEQGAVEKLEKFHKEQAEIHPERHPMPLRKGLFY